MKAPSIYLAGLVSLFVLSACTVPPKNNEAEVKDKEKVNTEASTAADPSPAAAPAPRPAATSLRLVPCTVPNQKNCR